VYKDFSKEQTNFPEKLANLALISEKLIFLGNWLSGIVG